MSHYTDANFRNERRAVRSEPLLPVEKKLIAWSLGLGIVLLAALVAINYLFPLTF